MDFFSLAQEHGFRVPNFTSHKNVFPNSQCFVLDGRPVASDLLEQAKKLAKNKTKPHLAVILVGNDIPSQIYVSYKTKAFLQVGFSSNTICVPAEQSSTESIVQEIEKLNRDPNCHGILVQLPLPAHVDKEKILATISPQKDVDGFSATNMGLLARGELGGFLACTPFGIMVLLKAYGIDLLSKHVVVVGRSNLVGRPMSLLALHANATVTMTHSKTKNLSEITKQADVLIVATGKAGIISNDFVKPGAVIIDVGIHRDDNGSLCGDVNPSVQQIAEGLSPVPGGVGPMTIAMLVINTALAAWR